MKPILITIDSFGESLAQLPACSLLFSSFNFGADPSSWDSPLNDLAGLDVGSDRPGLRLCVVVDLSLPERTELLRKLISSLREHPHRTLDHAYVLLPQQVMSGNGAVFGPGSPFKRVFILPHDVSSNGGVESASMVLMAHGIPELGSYVYRPGAPAAVHAQAWCFASHALQPGVESSVKTASDLLRETIESIDTVIEDLKGRINRMLEMVESLGRKEIYLYQSSIPDIKELVTSLSSKEFNPESIDWDKWFATLPRGLEVKVKLTIARGEAWSGPGQLEEMSNSLPMPKGDEKWELEAEVVAAILYNFVTVENKTWFNTIPPVLREQISSNCRRLLRAFDSPLIRRRMLESLLHYGLANSNPQGNGIQAAVADSMESVRDELRRHLQQLRGGGVFLILPKNPMDERHRNELRSWVEQVMGSPCELVLTERSDGAWLYVETPYEAGAAATARGFPGPVVETLAPSKGDEKLAEGAKVDESFGKDLGPEPPPPPPGSRCPGCGAPSSEPRLNLPPDPGTRHQNGSRPRKTCPTCGRLNAKAWWVCWNHGKAPILIPIDKVRCPDCILCHHKDPEGFPLSKISVRPGYQEPLNCPNCERKRRWDPGHPVFQIPENLIRFYWDGVNGHDSTPFRAIVRESGLLGDCYCPNCGTLLIPVHHRNKEASLPS